MTLCFAPLLRWVLSLWHGDRLFLALDATTLEDRFSVLAVCVIWGKCAIPVAWKILPGNKKKAWNLCPIISEDEASKIYNHFCDLELLKLEKDFPLNVQTPAPSVPNQSSPLLFLKIELYIFKVFKILLSIFYLWLHCFWFYFLNFFRYQLYWKKN